MIQPHVLVVDDDDKLRHLLDQYLTRSGFVVTEAEDPLRATEILKLFSFDVIVMDVMMPHENGVAYTKRLRQNGLTTPVLILTAMGDTNNRISGLEAGANDYLSKPFDPKELLLRLKNLLKDSETHEIKFGDFVYYNGHLSKGGKRVNLTGCETALLQALIKTPNQAVAREELARQTQTDSVRTIDVQMARLRRKIEEDVKHPFWIQTVRGKGYKLVSA